MLRRSSEKYCCDCNARQENDYQLLIKDFHHEIRTAKDDDKRAEQESRTERRNEKVPSKRRSGNERKRNEKVRMMKNCMRLHVNFCVSLVHPFICYIWMREFSTALDACTSVDERRKESEKVKSICSPFISPWNRIYLYVWICALLTRTHTHTVLDKLLAIAFHGFFLAFFTCAHLVFFRGITFAEIVKVLSRTLKEEKCRRNEKRKKHRRKEKHVRVFEHIINGTKKRT